ncbi:TniQ family protein [Acinetobacter baumannii]
MYHVEPQWYIRTPIQEDEILSSWLIRSALDLGCSPLTLVNLLWEKWRGLTIDIDRGLSEERLELLLNHCFISKQDIQQTMFSRYYPALIPVNYNQNQRIPWLLALGIRNRSNVSGRQVCTQCLYSAHTPPYLRIKWRMGWHSGCDIHKTILIDHCPQCGITLQPTKIDIEHGSLAICTSCYADLSTFIQRSIEAEALRFQHQADQVLESQFGRYNQKDISSIEWFEIARTWLSFIRSPINMKSPKLIQMFESLNIDLHIDFPITPVAFEFLAVQEREKLLSILSKVMNLPCDLIVDRSLEYGVSRCYFWDKRKILPIQLQLMKNKMLKPSKIILSKASAIGVSRPKSKKSVQRKWLRLLRKISKDGSGGFTND